MGQPREWDELKARKKGFVYGCKRLIVYMLERIFKMNLIKNIPHPRTLSFPSPSPSRRNAMKADRSQAPTVHLVPKPLLGNAKGVVRDHSLTEAVIQTERICLDAKNK